MAKNGVLKAKGQLHITDVTFREIIAWRRRYVSTDPNLDPSLAEYFQLDFEPIELEIPRVIRLTVFTSPDGFVRVVEIHRIQTNDCELIRDDLDRIVRSSAKHLIGRERNKGAPYRRKVVDDVVRAFRENIMRPYVIIT
jgi:hypothetical protein